MNSHRLGSTAIRSPRFAVVGVCLAGDAVKHVGLLAENLDLTNDKEISAFHMPWGVELPGRMNAHAVGWTHDLDPEELGAIEDWLEGLKTIASKITYVACPASTEKKDVNGRTIGRTFSCVGLVCSCYAEALRIDLVYQSDLPLVPVALLVPIWGRGVDGPLARRLLGQATGPWPVLLPSYVFRALLGTRAALPYRPSRADPCFPPQLRLRYSAHAWLRKRNLPGHP